MKKYILIVEEIKSFKKMYKAIPVIFVFIKSSLNFLTDEVVPSI